MTLDQFRTNMTDEDQALLLAALQMHVDVSSGKYHLIQGVFETRPAYLPRLRRLHARCIVAVMKENNQ